MALKRNETHQALLSLILVIALSTGVQGAIALGSPNDCDDGSHVIFDMINDVNPSYQISNVPIYGTMTLSFGSRFDGQTLGPPNNSLDDTSPNGPLSLLASPIVQTGFDFANATGIVLGGRLFETPISMLFDNPVSHVCFNLGSLDVNSPTLIEAYMADGTSLGAVNSLDQGVNRYSVTDTSGDNVISGISIYIPADAGMDWEGFAIQDVAFNVSEGVIPEPATCIIWSLLGLVAFSASIYARSGRSRD